MPTVAQVKNMPMEEFLRKSKEDQRQFIDLVNIQDIKAEQNPSLLKKVIAMKVITEARHAAEDKSCLNMTAQFRNFLSFFDTPDLQLAAYDPSKCMYKEGNNDPVATNSYRFFFISNMGAVNWKRKFYDLGVDDQYNLVSRKGSTKCSPCSGITTNFFPPNTWKNLTDKKHLQALFDEIQHETTYENTLGFDLLSAAMFCANMLWYISVQLSRNPLMRSLFLFPIALALNVAIYVLVVPPAFTLFVIEHLVVNPIQWLVRNLNNEHQAFIEAVTSPDSEQPVGPGV